MESLFGSGELGPLRLVYAQRIAELAKLEAILASVDGLDGCTKDLDAVLMQANRQIIGGLPADRHDHTCWLLQLHDVEDPLLAQLLEVEPVGLVEVRGYGLRVAIDDNRPL